jgi:agmatinase
MANFGGLLPEFTDPEQAFFFVLPVPYDLTSTYQSGSRRGPGAILEASANMELFDDELKRETYREGIHTLEPLEADARGPGEMTEKVRGKTAEILQKGKIPVVLGGEHSISFGVVRAMKEKFPGISVLQLDAHADLRDSYQETPFSHAAVARRIAEICPLVQAGIRSMSAEEGEFLAQSGISSFSADFIQGNPDWPEAVCRGLTEDVYLTIDLDVLDPAFMPATGTPEPGGWSWHDVLRLVREVSRSRRIRGFDVVELSPIPGMVAPDFLAAKLVYRIMGYIMMNS